MCRIDPTPPATLNEKTTGCVATSSGRNASALSCSESATGRAARTTGCSRNSTWYAGPFHGRHCHRPPPENVDRTIIVPVPPVCPRCSGVVAPTRVAVQLQEELPVGSPVVRGFDVGMGHCAACGRRVQGRHPWQTSDALGAAAVQLWPRTNALIVVLNKQLGPSHGKVARLLRDHSNRAVTASTVTRTWRCAAQHAQPTYAALCEVIRGSPVVAPDETSWKVNGQLEWLRALATPYQIQPGRGFPQAAAVLGANYDGVLVSDGWSPYRQFTAAGHQSCVAHLLRRYRDLMRDHPRAPFAARVKTLLQQKLGIHDRRSTGTLSAHGAAVARGHVLSQLLTALDEAGTLPTMQRFAAHLQTELPALLSFLFDTTVDGHELARRARLAGSCRQPQGLWRQPLGPRGANTQQVLTSVLRTAQQRQLDAAAVLVELLRAPHPTVSQALAPPTSHSPR
jgi:transposase